MLALCARFFQCFEYFQLSLAFTWEPDFHLDVRHCVKSWGSFPTVKGTDLFNHESVSTH